jgi:hypothetical protein
LFFFLFPHETTFFYPSSKALLPSWSTRKGVLLLRGKKKRRNFASSKEIDKESGRQPLTLMMTAGTSE